MTESRQQFYYQRLSTFRANGWKPCAAHQTWWQARDEITEKLRLGIPARNGNKQIHSCIVGFAFELDKRGWPRNLTPVNEDYVMKPNDCVVLKVLPKHAVSPPKVRRIRKPHVISEQTLSESTKAGQTHPKAQLAYPEAHRAHPEAHRAHPEAHRAHRAHTDAGQAEAAEPTEAERLQWLIHASGPANPFQWKNKQLAQSHEPHRLDYELLPEELVGPTPPPHYVCENCSMRGHFLNNCPWKSKSAGNDRAKQRPILRKPTGIPKAHLRELPKEWGSTASSNVLVDPQSGRVFSSNFTNPSSNF